LDLPPNRIAAKELYLQEVHPNSALYSATISTTFVNNATTI
jgi:hypothetical protein